MKKKLTILAFSLLLAVGWTSVAHAQLKAEPKLKTLTKFSGPVSKHSSVLTDVSDIKSFGSTDGMKKAPKRANITASATMTRAEYEAITYDWVDANSTLHPDVKITEPATNPYQIAYLLGTTYMNPNIPGLKYSAVFAQDNPYPNIEFGWDLPHNPRWSIGAEDVPTTYNDITISIPSYWMDFDYIYVQSNGTTVEGGSWSYAVDGKYLPSNWGGTATLTEENNGCCTQSGGGTIIIPHSIIDGLNNVTVVMSARRYNNAHSGTDCTVTIAGATPESNEYTTTTYTEKTWNINPQSGSGLSGPGTNYSNLEIYLPSYNMSLYSITVKNANGTTLTSWDAITAYNNGEYGSYENGSSTSNYYTLPGWTYNNYLTLYSTNGYVSGLVGYMPGGGSIFIPSSLLNGTPSITVTIQAYSDEDGENLYVNGEAKAMTTSLDTYTWTFQGDNYPSSVTPPIDNGYTVFLVKVKDGTGAAPLYTFNWDSGSNALIDYFTTYIDEVQLLTDGLRLNEGTDDAGTMFSYSGELNRFYFLGKGADFWWGSSELDEEPHLAPTYDMYEEFSPTTTDTGDEITDFYSKLLYGNSYNVIHDCRGMNYFQHYFSMSGNDGTEHKSMTNLVFWIPDNRGAYQQRDYDEEYLPHVGLYTITLEAEAQRAANYSTSNRKYDVTLDWVSSLNSILDFDVDQDYELWVYIYDDQGNPIADYKVLDRLQMQDLLVHNNTTFTYQVDQLATSQTIVYRVKGWPKDATNSPAKGGDFFALSNLDPVLIPGYENFLSLGVEHYESDFALDVEHNYYRNFLTIDNLNPDNALTAARIENGEDEYELYRFDVAKPNQLTKAADLLFSVDNNKVAYLIEYANQDYIDEANLYNEYNNANLQGYTDPDALGCPTYGEIATISEGGGEIPTPTPATQTVADGSATNSYVPVAGNYQDWGYRSQMIYTADMLDMVQGDEINSITLYPQQGLKFAGSTITFKLCNTSEANFGTASSSSVSRKTVSGEVTATINNPSANTSATTWTITFDSPLTYTGGNLLLDVYCVGFTHDGITGSYSTSPFYGANNQTNYQSMYKTGSSSATPAADATGTNQKFLPKATFDYTSMNGGGSSSGSSNFTLLNDFLDNSTYTQVGQVVFELPWKSIQVKLQDESAGTSGGYFLIQNNGKLRFVMPAGYNNANLKFTIHNAPVSSNYYFGTFTLSSSTGDTQTITIPEGSSVYGDKDYDAIFTGISSGDVITITGTHTVGNTLYNYSPDFKYIHVSVQGGTGGISENTALNLDAIKFVDQFKASTSEDTHPYRYGYVLKAVGSNQESGRPEIPVLHTNSTVHGFYSLHDINNDVDREMVDPVNVMNGEVNMTLSRDPEIFYYTLDRKPSTVNNAQWESVSKLQRREDDSYNEMFNFLPQYDDQVCNPPTLNTTPWIVDRFDNYDVKEGGYNSFMSYVPVIWTHGDQKNRRVKWATENRHNSYGAPIWKTGVAKVQLTSVKAERQEDISTKWTYAGEECSLYMLDDITAVATMPTVNNVKYVPYMFRIFVKSDNHKLRGYTQVAADVDPNKPGEHYEGAPIANDELKCVWSGYVNDLHNADYKVTISEDVVNNAKVYTFHKDKVDRTNPGGEWDKDIENAIFAAPENLIQGEGENMYIAPNDLTIIVRFYYLVEGFDDSAPDVLPNRGNRGEGSDPAGYGTEGEGFTPGPATAVRELILNGVIESVTYVNAQGMQSSEPFDGLNIVITRYSNGAVRTTKVIK